MLRNTKGKIWTREKGDQKGDEKGDEKSDEKRYEAAIGLPLSW